MCNDMDESQKHYAEWKKKSAYHVVSFIWNSRISKVTYGDTN